MTAELFLQKFFGDSNKVKYQDVLTHRSLHFLRKSILRLYSEPKEFVLLPFIVEERKNTLWCGIAFNEEQSNEMRSLLNYFVGHSFANLNSKSTINSHTPVGKVIEQFTDLKLCVKFLGDYTEIQMALERMFAILSKRPNRLIRRNSSIGSLLRSYYYALAQKDESEAHRLIGELRSRKILDAENQIFLNIEVAAQFSKWDIINNHPQLPNILKAKRPAKITSYLLQAAFERKIAPLIEEGKLEFALNYFSTELLPEIQPLFLDGLVDDHPRVLKMWMLKAVTDENPNNVLYRLLTEEANKKGLDDLEWQALTAIRAPEFVLPTFNPEAAQELMIQALHEGDLLQAKEFGKEAPDSLAKAQMLLQCAVQQQDLEAFNQYLIVKQVLTNEEVIFLNQTVQKSFSSIGRSESWYTSETALPNSWIELVERINDDEDFARNSVNPLLSNSSFIKSADQTEFNHLDIDKLNAALGRNRELVNNAALIDILPHLITFLKGAKVEERGKAILFNTILDLLIITDELRKSDLDTINDLIDRVLSSGVTNNRYNDLLMAINGLADYYDTIHTVDCLMGFIEVVIQYRIQDNGSFQAVLGTLKRIILHQSTLKPQDDLKRLFNGICVYLGFNEFSLELPVDPTTEEINPWKFYQGKRIGIYTLTESAALRAQEFLTALNLNINTIINNDHAGSDALKDLATRSDVLVIVAGSAKHAATDYIKQRHASQPILYASGKGTSSILNALRNHATNEV